MALPEIKTDSMYQLLREEKIEEFNQRREAGEECDLQNCDFRSLDLRGMNAHGLDMRNCYFRQCDLRGIDFSETMLEGASINGAKISGVMFPDALGATEIELSLVHGTRMRYQRHLVVKAKVNHGD